MIPGHGRGGPTPGRQLCGVAPPRLTAVGDSRAVRGQVLALLLPLLAVLIAALWWVLETGEGVAEKQRMRNTADAAVLAGAVWQAKVLNFDAHMNRAIVANEAVIAQAVSLRGWSAYMDDMLPKAYAVTSAVPYLGTAMFYLQRGWSLIDQALQPALIMAEAGMSVIDHDFALAQRTVHAAYPAALDSVIREVVERNDPRYEVTTGGQWMLMRTAFEWSKFTAFYGGSWRWRQRDVVQRSMDGFSHERNWSLNLLPGGLVGRLEKRAGTDLVDFDTWRALETLALHQRRYLIFGRMREVSPIGWAGVENGSRTLARGVHGGAYRSNPRTARLAEQSMRSGSGYLGLPSMWDLSAIQRSVFSPPVIAIRVSLRESDRRSAGGWFEFKSLAGLSATDSPAATKSLGSTTEFPMMVEAAATTSFVRPVPRADGAQEAPSLYNPYWRPRLVSLSAVDRLQLAVLDGDPQWLAGVPR
jgi:hypothetical protein